MQENEFEKNLQQKIDKLQLQPTDELWQKIQEQVAAKKRRRRGVVFFFILSGLIIAGLSLTNMNGLVYENETASAKTNEPRQKEINAIKENTVLSSDKEAAVKLNEDKQPQTISIKNNQNTATDNPAVNAVALKNITKPHPLKIKTKASSRTKIISTKPENDNTGDIAATTSQAGNSTDSVNNDRGKNIVAEDKTGSTVAIKDKEPLIDVAKKEPLKNENTIAKESKKTETKNHSKWGIALTVSGGISSTGNRYLSEGLYAADYSGATPGTGANSGSGNAYKPSQTKPGVSFIAGINLYREILKSSRITAGLQYQLINTSIKTGQEIALSSSSVRDAFIYGTTKNYTNHYHFISIPVGFSTQLFKIGQREIWLDAGVNFSKLISTNALNFSGGQGFYYKDESVFNKIQTGLSVAAKINLAAKNKAALYIGPEFYYSLTPLASSGIYANAHASYIGLKLQKNLKK